ncbi:hypothetical protein PIB30_068700, partial [Stylosanthes scabra]|nr:hypothetical protein [Stylosanthes scabra]
MVVLSFQVVLPSPSQEQHHRRRRTLRNGKNGSIWCGIAEPSGKPAPFGQKTHYNDSVFEKAFMTLFARKMEKFAEPVKEKDKKKMNKGWWDWGYDYESFVNVSKRVMERRSRAQQQQVVREVLLSMLPPGAPAQVCNSFFPVKFHVEYNQMR